MRKTKTKLITNELKFENGLLAVGRPADQFIKGTEIDLEQFIDTDGLMIENVASNSFQNMKARSNDTKELIFHQNMLQVLNDSESILVDINDPSSIKEVDRLYNKDAFEKWNHFINTGHTL